MIKRYLKNLVYEILLDNTLISDLKKELTSHILYKSAKAQENRDRNIQILTSEVDKIKKHLNL